MRFEDYLKIGAVVLIALFVYNKLLVPEISFPESKIIEQTPQEALYNILNENKRIPILENKIETLGEDKKDLREQLKNPRKGNVHWGWLVYTFIMTSFIIAIIVNLLTEKSYKRKAKRMKKELKEFVLERTNKKDKEVQKEEIDNLFWSDFDVERGEDR